jgi:regulator of RNase E activity RraA
MKCVGRAVTLRFVPARPDIAQDKPPGGASPEYEAFELCGPDNVLVMSSVGPWESVGGDIKFLRLKQLQIGGLVTDGSVRDTDEIIKVRVICRVQRSKSHAKIIDVHGWLTRKLISVHLQ